MPPAKCRYSTWSGSAARRRSSVAASSTALPNCSGVVRPVISASRAGMTTEAPSAPARGIDPLSAAAVAVVATLATIYIVSQFIRNSIGVIAPNLVSELLPALTNCRLKTGGNAAPEFFRRRISKRIK